MVSLILLLIIYIAGLIFRIGMIERDNVGIIGILLEYIIYNSLFLLSFIISVNL